MDKTNKTVNDHQDQIFTMTTVTKTELAKTRGYNRQALNRMIKELNLLQLYADHSGLTITHDQFNKMRNLPVSLANFIYRYI